MPHFSEAELQEIGAQLRMPDGAKGLEIAESMNENNRGMIENTVRSLQIQKGDVILEIGPGNADHVREMVPRGIEYHGVDIAPTMVEDARRRLGSITDPKIEFHLYEGSILPFADKTFDRIFTVNTIYFWKEPAAFLQEIHRVLRPGGTAAITFAQRSFMEKLPFTKWHFTFYDTEKLRQLVAGSPFRSAEFRDHSEMIEVRTGDTMPRDYTVALVRRE
jgi:ubiquinone/menaquinone biosynthesis C-methylase UbiE